MCTYITLVAASDRIDAIRAVLESHATRQLGREVAALDNACVRGVLAPAERQFLLTRRRGGCDCGTVLGMDLPAEETEARRARELEKLKRRGWPPAKLARAMEDFGKAAARTQHRQAPHDSLEGWPPLLSSIAGALGLGRISLMHHFYRKSPEDEVFSVSRQNGGPLDGALSVLPTMVDGVVYDFTVPSAGRVNGPTGRPQA